MENTLWDTLPKNTHYFSRYIKFIENNQSTNSPQLIHEKHHIIPKSLGGTDAKNNLVLLTPRAHLIAHILLWKSFPGCNKMSFAVHQMTTRLGNFTKSSRIYESIKLEHSIACSERNTGRVLPDDWKIAIREGHKKYDHSHLKTEEARQMARHKANTILKSEDVIKRRQNTMKAKGESHASKRNEVRSKIGKSHQKLQIDAYSPNGEVFIDIYITDFINRTGISKFMIKKFVDKGIIPPPPSAFLARWNKSHNPHDEGRIKATGWEFKSSPPCVITPV